MVTEQPNARLRWVVLQCGDVVASFLVKADALAYQRQVNANLYQLRRA